MMMILLSLLIKTCITRFMLIHIDTLCDRISLSCEFAEILDSVHFMKQPKSTTELSNHISKKISLHKHLRQMSLQTVMQSGWKSKGSRWSINIVLDTTWKKITSTDGTLLWEILNNYCMHITFLYLGRSTDRCINYRCHECECEFPVTCIIV